MQLLIALGMGAILCAGCVLRFGEPPIPTQSSEQITNTTAGWETVAPGLEQRNYVPDNNILGQLTVLRIDPARYSFRVHYQPGTPLTLERWQGQLPNVAAFINANFFDQAHRILGLLVIDNVVHGEPYRDRGGTFLVQNGIPRVRSNLLEPYNGEALEQAVQAFPMLVQNGETAFTSTQPDRATRRTVVAQDSSGRILLMVTPLLGLRLAEISAYLPTTDLDIVNAFNLDGGGSSMLYYQASGSETQATIPSLDPVPAVLAIYAR